MLFTKGTVAQHQAANQTESLACSYLESQGLVKKEQNFRCKIGEIDLIMLDQSTLVFVEVRLRKHELFASASESINYKKQQKMVKTAQFYLQQNQLFDKVNCRFDAVTFDKSLTPDWLKNIF